MLMAIEHAGISITTDVLKSNLLDMVPDDASGSKTNAFMVRNKNYRKSSNVKDSVKTAHDNYDRRNDKSKITCFRCKQTGHFMSKSDSKYTFSVVIFNAKYNTNDFYPHSGASKHMSPN
ncbi:hypothetical protein WA026_021069 [Henosepilachna vigintioctopunctata]|uniref:CCHC-type domain-containing protein n=1 Tax=Henosepilachna vigintioctopunctata TaxID=420089 RepID=A0AAW1V2J7_9CUCU